MAKIAVVTLDGFNEIDSFVASYMLGRVDRPDWSVAIASPTPQVTSMNGVTVSAQMSLQELPEADAVIVGSGMRTREFAADPAFSRRCGSTPAGSSSGPSAPARCCWPSSACSRGCPSAPTC